MSICFGTLFLIVSGVLLMISMLRWFEQTRDAADDQNWARLMLLVIAPPIVWVFPSRVSAGRPMPIARHEPVRGFGGLPKGGIVEPGVETAPIVEQAPAAGGRATRGGDGPPPGTPPEFIGMPKIPPKKAPKAVDPEKIAKLREKMREQGMLPEE